MPTSLATTSNYPINRLPDTTTVVHFGTVRLRPECSRIRRQLSAKPGARFGPYKYCPPLGPAAWARSIARATRASTATSRSRSCRRPAADTELGARFEREAQAIAALNHPHICTLLRRRRRQRARDYLVMELLEGETLAARLAARGAAARRGAAPRHRDRRALDAGAPRRHRPSRSQAGQHHAHEGGREAARLRAGEG